MSPYIVRERRPPIDDGVNVALDAIHNPGDLNYAISTLCLGYLAKEPQSYERFNSVVGVLACASMELYRKDVAVYEDRAMVRNGPI